MQNQTNIKINFPSMCSENSLLSSILILCYEKYDAISFNYSGIPSIITILILSKHSSSSKY